jgi:hypothetical protein
VADRQKLIDDAVKAATERVNQAVNFGSIPAMAEMFEAKLKAKAEYGLDLPIDTLAEAKTRYGSTEKAYGALTAEASAKRSADRQAELEASHKAAVESAREEGKRIARAEMDNRAYNPEETGSSGILPMTPPQDNKELQGVNPQSYNPSDGTLAREAAQRLAKEEGEGKWAGVQRLM